MTSIKFSGKSVVTVEAEWDETVLDALLRSGSPVPFFCRSGICGQCKSRLLAGEVTEIGNAPTILSEEERRQGYILICRSLAVTDCEVEPENLPDERGSEPAWPQQSELVSAAWVSAELFHFRVQAAESSEQAIYLFHPGQYSHLLGDAYAQVFPSRLYPATRPGRTFLDFYVAGNAAVHERSMSLFRPGAKLELARPVGASSLQEGEKGPVLIIAEQDGLSGALSMLELLAMREDPTSLRMLVRGAGEHYLEKRIGSLCRETGIPMHFFEAQSLESVLAKAVSELESSTARSAGRLQAYVKGSEKLVSASRRALFQSGLRPWEVHADILAGLTYATPSHSATRN